MTNNYIHTSCIIIFFHSLEKDYQLCMNLRHIKTRGAWNFDSVGSDHVECNAVLFRGMVGTFEVKFLKAYNKI